jgi:hypothetical protein
MTDELHPELKSLFERARADEDPSSADRGAVRGALSARLGVAVAAGAATALGANTVAAQGVGVASAIGAKTGVVGAAALWLVVGATIGTGVSLATVPAPTDPASPVPAAAHGVAQRLEARASDRSARTDSTPVGVTALRGLQAAPQSKQPPKSRPLSSKPPTSYSGFADREATRTSAPALGAETHALAAVQQALRDDRPEQALGLLEAQERTFAQGVLQAERAAARVLALCAGKRLAEARAAAAEFLREYPDSPVADRVRASCAR